MYYRQACSMVLIYQVEKVQNMNAFKRESTLLFFFFWIALFDGTLHLQIYKLIEGKNYAFVIIVTYQQPTSNTSLKLVWGVKLHMN